MFGGTWAPHFIGGPMCGLFFIIFHFFLFYFIIFHYFLLFFIMFYYFFIFYYFLIFINFWGPGPPCDRKKKFGPPLFPGPLLILQAAARIFFLMGPWAPHMGAQGPRFPEKKFALQREFFVFLNRGPGPPILFGACRAPQIIRGTILHLTIFHKFLQVFHRFSY